ncbi:hypothetical protein MSPP1_003437 [Malassezia sp. CBS 17886]|nr:hypothetical protein MSPP1_003437 [Malassezia sp. CBS 17886]
MDDPVHDATGLGGVGVRHAGPSPPVHTPVRDVIAGRESVYGPGPAPPIAVSRLSGMLGGMSRSSSVPLSLGPVAEERERPVPVAGMSAASVAPPLPSAHGLHCVQVAPLGDAPPPLRSHTASSDAGCDAWVFGGAGPNGCQQALYQFDADTHMWTRVNALGTLPSPRRAHSSVLVEGRLYVFGGGEGSRYMNDLHVFDTVTQTWECPPVKGTPPPARRAHSCCHFHGRLYVFGGSHRSGTLNDLYELDIRNVDALVWKRLQTNGPLPASRGYHTATMVHDTMIVIGGGNGQVAFHDVWVLNLNTLSWQQLALNVRYRMLGHSAVRVGLVIMVFGGHNNDGYTSGLLFFDLVGMQWEERPVRGDAITGRGSHQAWFHDNRLYIHGGFDGSRSLGELFVLDLAMNAYLSAAALPATTGVGQVM